ncbi:hypothetical protein ALDI51_18870 [Alicycliphilus denitrificans]|uniref:c-type cytochrome n=1 Tax=Alicycliphilus denitrificans TaxID=179636 RepID=UPI001F2FF0FB|nr:cytochrome c [Alicycliphilus denitrificans]BCN38568.1 hypothetical protein ALDI51_18870 [Alicycliphilus denitrificans]
MTLPSDALDALPGAMLAAQLALRDALHALGLTGKAAGQPAWPFAHRLAAEMLAIDGGHARRVALTLGCVLLAVALLAAALLVRARRVRGGLAAAALALVLLAPWPLPQLLLAPAVPTSLHRSPTGFAAEGIVRGQAVYMRLCARCHGVDARGEGPDAARLPVWPPMLTGGLLWKRLDGELFWRVRHGMHGRGGGRTMPGFGPVQISDAEIWQVLDYLQAHAAGRMLRESGAWERPVRMPAAALRCRHGGLRGTHSLRGQRLQVVLPAPGAPLPPEDPRMVSVVVGGAPSGSECEAADAHLLPALALLLGVAPAAAPGHVLLVDRAGWLRARAQPGQGGWSEDDLVCRSAPGARAQAPADGQGLDVLLRRMDADAVRLVRGGFPH